MSVPPGPLNGITVVDLTRVLAGPYCSMLLADLGARVIKIERPGHGDDARAIGPFVEGESAYFMSLNRGKESLALDLKSAEGRETLDALCGRADVLLENFTPGTLERLGFGWNDVHARHPRLILARTSGFGQTGPYASRPAYDVVVQAMGGVMSLTGHPDSPPTRVGTSLGDLAAGLFTVIGIQAALLDRTRTGVGQQVDVAMLDCQVALLENALARFHATGQVPGPIGSRHPSITPFAAFAAADGHLVIAAGNDALFRRLCETLGVPELPTDPRFRSNALRTENETALRDALEAALTAAPVAEWIERFQAAGIPCGPINDVAAVLADPQVRARNMVVEAIDPQGRPFQVAGNPVKLSAHPDPSTRGPVPELDGDRATILAELDEAPRGDRQT